MSTPNATVALLYGGWNTSFFDVVIVGIIIVVIMVQEALVIYDDLHSVRT